MQQKTFDHSNVKYVKRVVIGSAEPGSPSIEKEAQEGIRLLNRCLSESPSGRVMGMEKSFTVMNMGEHQIVVQWLVYHIGFTRKPLWLED